MALWQPTTCDIRLRMVPISVREILTSSFIWFRYFSLLSFGCVFILYYIFLCKFSIFISICLVPVYVKLIVIYIRIFIPVWSLHSLLSFEIQHQHIQQHLYSKSDFTFGSFALAFSSKIIFLNTFFEMFLSFSHCYVIVAGGWWML